MQNGKRKTWGADLELEGLISRPAELRVRNRTPHSGFPCSEVPACLPAPTGRLMARPGVLSAQGLVDSGRQFQSSDQSETEKLAIQPRVLAAVAPQ